jgi:hypothetical protein
MAEQNNRWWEFYLARYITGNMFAVLVLFYLVTFHGPAIQQSICPTNIPTKNQCPAAAQSGQSLNTRCIANSESNVLCTTSTKTKQSCTISSKTEESCADLAPQKVCEDTTVPELCKPGKFRSEIFSFIFITTKDVDLKDNKIAIMDAGFVLNKNAQINVTEINFANILVIGVFGFLYMYISSIPIYFLHIIRGGYLYSTFKLKIECPKLCFFRWVIGVPMMLVLVMLFLVKIISGVFNEINAFYLFGRFLYGGLWDMFFWILLMLLLLIIAFLMLWFLGVFDGFRGNVFEFLRQSTLKRDSIKYDKNTKKNKRTSIFSPEYIISYQHLRENGNAPGIILMEILFAWLLIMSNFSLLLLVSWLLLGFSGWFIGIYLEYKMVNYNRK